MIYGMSMLVETPFRDIPPGLINLLVGGIVSGEVGYQAYGDTVGWKNHLGQPMPAWSELTEAIRDAWNKAAYAIVEAACRAGEKCEPEAVCGCGHSSHHHDVAEADGSGSRCCSDGCGCGSDGR